MRKNRLLLSLTFALTCGAVACGGADDSSLNDSTESLRRGQSGDGGVKGGRRHERDSDADVDEDTDEAARGDGGKGHGRVSQERGDGGQCSRGAGHRGPRRGGKPGADSDEDRGQDEDQDREQDEENDSEDGKGGLSGPKLDGGGRRGGKPGSDAGAP